MNITTKTLLASAILGLAAAGPVQADLFATSVIYTQNLLFLNDDGDVLDAVDDFNSLVFTSSADSNGDLSGTGGFNFPDPAGDDIDFPSSCLSTTGNCNPIAENTFPIISGPQGTDYVAADQLQEGAPITNLLQSDGTTVFGTGANIGQAAYGSLSGTNAEGSANVNNGLESLWTFSLSGAGAITIEANVIAYLQAFAGADEQEPGKASAAYSFTITVTNVATGLVVFNSEDFAAFDLLNETTSANAFDALPTDVTTCGNLSAVVGDCNTALADPNFSVTTGVLLENTPYQLSIRSNANIDIARVERIPEPSVLALLGLGFLGMSLRRRRRA